MRRLLLLLLMLIVGGACAPEVQQDVESQRHSRGTPDGF